MITNNTSNRFIQSIDDYIQINDSFYSQNIDTSRDKINVQYDNNFSQHIDSLLDKGVYKKNYTDFFNNILEHNVSDATSNLLFKSKKFKPKKLDTTFNSIYDDITEFKTAVIEKFKSNIMSEELEFGVIGNTTKDIEEFLLVNKDYTINAITQYALDNFDNVHIVYSVLHTIAHVDYNLISPTGATFALSASLHTDVEIKDFAIQCFDMWESKDSLGYLKSIQIEIPWLNNYLQEVIENIEELDV